MPTIFDDDDDDDADDTTLRLSVTGFTYTTQVILVHGIPRKAKLMVKISGWFQGGRVVDTETIDIPEEASRDTLEQLRIGAVLFELYCIKKGVSSETKSTAPRAASIR